eukprot:4540814-Prymnesium_polylepis.1
MYSSNPFTHEEDCGASHRGRAAHRGRRTEGSKPSARSRAARWAQRRAHGRRARRPAPTGRAAATAAAAVTVWGVGCGARAGARPCSQRGARGTPVRRCKTAASAPPAAVPDP